MIFSIFTYVLLFSYIAVSAYTLIPKNFMMCNNTMNNFHCDKNFYLALLIFSSLCIMIFLAMLRSQISGTIFTVFLILMMILVLIQVFLTLLINYFPDSINDKEKYYLNDDGSIDFQKLNKYLGEKFG